MFTVYVKSLANFTIHYIRHRGTADHKACALSTPLLLARSFAILLSFHLRYDPISAWPVVLQCQVLQLSVSLLMSNNLADCLWCVQLPELIASVAHRWTGLSLS